MCFHKVRLTSMVCMEIRGFYGNTICSIMHVCMLCQHDVIALCCPSCV